MRLTTLFLLATLAMFVNLANAFQITDQHYFTADYDGKVKNTLTGEPMVDPGDFVNNLRGSVTVMFFTDTRIDGQNAGEKPADALTPTGQLNATWKSGGDAAFRFRNGFLKIDAAGDNEATFTLLVDNLRGSVPANSFVGDDDVWVVVPTWVSAGPESPVVNNVNVKDAYSTIFSLIARSNLDGITEHRGTVGQHGLAQANQAPNVIGNISDYRQETQNIFLNNHPSEPPESLQYRAFPVTFPNAVQELVSVELQIELQDSVRADSRKIEVYDFAVTKDLSSLGLAIRNPCAFDGDASCNTDDLDALYTVFNTSVPPSEALFDLNADNVVGEADLTEWLSLAASRNGYKSPYLRGDTELDRNVDITDFNSLATNFDPDGSTAPHSWLEGNFDGDNDIDITDFNFLASNFAPDGYGASNAIPEPSSFILCVFGILAVSRFVSRREVG